MKKLMTIMTAIAMSMATFSYTDAELAKMDPNDVPQENVLQAFDAYYATTNWFYIYKICQIGKISFSDVANKIAELKINVDRASVITYLYKETNYQAIATIVNSFDLNDILPYSKKRSCLNCITRHSGWIVNTNEGIAFARKVLAVDPMLAAHLMLQPWFFKNISSLPITDEIYEKAKPLCKTTNQHIGLAFMLNYGYYYKKDHINDIYQKNAFVVDTISIYPQSSLPENREYMQDYYAFVSSCKKTKATTKILLNLAKMIDMMNNSTKCTEDVFSKIDDISAKADIAIKLDNVDFMIDVMTNCDNSLTTTQLEAFMKKINGIDIDYKAAQVLKALKTVNARYTLKLYDDRDIWEPILSKIRAMIDVRN